MSKRKWNDTDTPLNGYGVYMMTKDGKINGYIDRPLDNGGHHVNPLLMFSKPNEAHSASEKLNHAGQKFGKWAMTPKTAREVLDTVFYPQPEVIAFVICYRPSGYRHHAVNYVLREWTEQDADDLAHNESDTSIIYETPDYATARYVRDLLNREFQLNRTHAQSLADVQAILKECVVNVG